MSNILSSYSHTHTHTHTHKQTHTHRDLYWEQHYTTISMAGHEQDEVFDVGLSEYPLPEQIEKLIEAGIT